MNNQLLERITHHPDICHGKPCIRGLRYPVEFILELLSSGMTIEEILADYEDLEREDIQAVFLFASHTKDLPQQNSTSDNQINEISLQQERIVISKDSDFVNSFLTIQKPYKLLLISTGNISNSELEAIFVNQLSRLVNLFESHQYIELSRDAIIVHH
jgi:uncharacterized protein (DUF433 family)